MEITDSLKQTQLFAGLSDADIDTLAQSTRLEVFEGDHIILREGRVGAAFYVILSGKVEVIKGMAGAEPVVIGTLGVGDFFGEVAAMKHVTRSASVKALEKTTCLVIRRLDLDSFVERYPSIASKVDAALAARFDKS